MDYKMLDELIAEGYDFEKNPKHYKLKHKPMLLGGNPANESLIPRTVVLENTVHIVKRGQGGIQ